MGIISLVVVDGYFWREEIWFGVVIGVFVVGGYGKCFVGNGNLILLVLIISSDLGVAGKDFC